MSDHDRPPPEQVLVALIARHGPALPGDPKRLKGLLWDLCHDRPRERSVLFAAVEKGVAADLARTGGAVAWELQRGRLVDWLHDETGIDLGLAGWAVETWAVALGVLPRERLRGAPGRPESRELSAARYPLGQYVLREPDYRQILDWAQALGKAPEWVLEQLADSRLEPRSWEDFEQITFFVEDGSIRSLVWDCDRFSSDVPDSWQKGLLIHTLGVGGDVVIGEWWIPERTLAPDLNQLRRLSCNRLEITRLDLSRTPELTWLSCSCNNLAALDLRPVPGLTELYCAYNRLAALDLRPVPGLTALYCENNRLAALDLRPVPGLTVLNCANNQLTALDLRPVPRLVLLMCDKNVRLFNAPLDLNLIVWDGEQE